MNNTETKPSATDSSANNLVRRIQPKHILPTLTAAFIIALLEIVLAASFAALIFSGELREYINQGLGLGIMGAVIAGVVVALFTSRPGIVSGNQDVPAAIIASAAAVIAASMPAGATGDQTFATVVSLIIITSLLTGIFFLALGAFKLGGLVRFLPYPVVGGFLASTGWLLVIGAVGMMAGVSEQSLNLTQLVSPEVLLYWLPGAILAVVLFLLLKRSGNYLFWPILLLVATLAFFLVASLSGYSVADLGSGGWLLGPFPGGVLWQPVTLELIQMTYWPAIQGQVANIATILLISSVALLLNAGGIELSGERDLRFDRELQAAGAGNILAGLAGGQVGYQQLSLSVMNFRLQSDSRWTGLIAAGFCIIALFFGSSFLALFPKLILGALLMMLGLIFLIEWLFEAWFKMSRDEYAIIVVIFLVSAFVGFLEAVAVGILTSVVIFVVNYSRVDLVRHQFDGSYYRSRVRRPRPQQLILDERGSSIYILELQGFIFFGTADTLFKEIRKRLTRSDLPPPRFIILDFRRVTGLDSTALRSFNRLRRLAEGHRFTIAITNASPTVTHQLESGDFGHDGQIVHFFSHLDQGVEWCEDHMLSRSGMAEADAFVSFIDQLANLAPDAQNLDIFLEYLYREEFEAGSYLMQKGDPPDSLYFIDQGQVTAQLETEGEKVIRLETMGVGSVVGELGFYLKKERTASVMADVPTIAYRLDLPDLERMEQEHSEAASNFHRIIVLLLAERVTHLINTVNALEN